MIRHVRVALSVLTMTTLSACAITARSPDSNHLPSVLSALHEAQRTDRTGSVDGFLALYPAGAPVPLHDWPVMLLPATPELEAAIAAFHHTYLAQGPAPLSPAQLQQARQLLRDAAERVRRVEPRSLIQTAKTGQEEPRFQFLSVPEGRWLLIAELTAKRSALLWAVPVIIRPGQQVHQSLNEGSVWVEGLLP